MKAGRWIIGLDSVSIGVGQWLRIIAWTRRSRPRMETVRRWRYGLSWLMVLLYGCAEQKPQSMSSADLGPVAIYRPHAEPNALTSIKWPDPPLPHQGQSSAALPDLPLIESRASDDSNDTLAVLLSGDGGWAAFDKGITAVLASNRISTVGWDSLSYYWKPRTPDQAASDLARLLRHYMTSWQKQRLLLIGYSFGADVLPFLINRLPADLRRQIDGIALFGLAKTAAFEFHLTDWFGGAATQTYPIAPEFSQLHEAPILCVYGESETDSLCPTLAPPIQVAKVPGDHHFKHDYVGLVSHILDLVPRLNPGPRRRPPGVAQ